MKTTIEITDIAVDCIIGVTEQERAQKQTVLVTVELVVDTPKAATFDNVADAVDYKSVYTKIVDFVTASQFYLLEALTKHVLDVCMGDPRVVKSRVTIEKPSRLPNAKGVSVTQSKEKDE